MDAAFLTFEIIGTVAFAISGAIVAIDKETDLFGVLFLAVITSFGGGIIRDTLIGNTPPLFFTNYIPVISCIVSALAVFIVARLFKRGYIAKEKAVCNINNYFDALGLGVFAVAGTEVCIKAGFTNPFIAITLGMISAVGGGMIRDLILREIPFVLCKRIYAVAALFGASLYYLLDYLGVPYVICASSGIALVFVVRICATVFKWSLPKAIVFSSLKTDTEKDSEPETLTK